MTSAWAIIVTAIIVIVGLAMYLAGFGAGQRAEYKIALRTMDQMRDMYLNTLDRVGVEYKTALASMSATFVDAVKKR